MLTQPEYLYEQLIIHGCKIAVQLLTNYVFITRSNTNKQNKFILKREG